MVLHYKPKLNVVDKNIVVEIIGKAYDILGKIGLRIEDNSARDLLGHHGAKIDSQKRIVKIPSNLVDSALKTVTKKIEFFDLTGKKALTLGGNKVYFSPGAWATHILDFNTNEIKKPTTSDQVACVRLADGLDHIHFNRPPLLITDIPEKLSDIWSYYLTIRNSKKPITGSVFSFESMVALKECLVILAGDDAKMAKKPMLSISLVSKAPLTWGALTCLNILYCAEHNIPVRIHGMPAAGASSPVTLLGTVVQQTAENLGGIVLHQLTNPGAPVCYGGTLTVFDMKNATMPLGAMESQLMNILNAQVGKYLGMPTYGILAPSDSKLCDTQAGLESANGVMLGALARINMIAGAGMLDLMLCHSLEKYVIDNEINAMALNLIKGVALSEETLGFDTISDVGPGGDFLGHEHTLKWLKKEQYYPSPVINRKRLDNQDRKTVQSSYRAANDIVRKILKEKEVYPYEKQQISELEKIVKTEARRNKVDELPRW